MATKTPLDQSLIQRVVSGAKFIVTGVTPTGFFTPAQPVQPIAQEAAIGRRYDYPVGVNVNFRPKTTESGISYEMLRSLADSLDVLRLVIETRKDQLAAIDWDVAAKEGKTVSDATLAEIKLKLSNPTREQEFDEWLRMIMEDVFVLDAIAIYPRMTRGGGLYSLDLIDAGTIKLVIDDSGRTPLPPDPAYQQILKGVPAVDYTSDELIYRMRNPRTNRMYGFSPVEQIIMTVNIALRRQLSQLQYYTEGNIPEALASVPDTWNPDQVAQFQLYFDSLMSGNMANKSRLKFIPMDTSKVKETKDPKMKDDFDEWLARVVCYCFSVPPTPFIKQMNRATGETAKESALQEGLLPLMGWVKRMMTSIIATRIGNADVEFIWRQDDSLDPLEQAEIDKIHVSTGIRTAEAIHAERGFSGAFGTTTPTPAPGEAVSAEQAAAIATAAGTTAPSVKPAKSTKPKTQQTE